MNNFTQTSSNTKTERFNRKSLQIFSLNLFFQIFLLITGFCMVRTGLAANHNNLQITNIVQSPSNSVSFGDTVSYTLTVANTDTQNRFAEIQITSFEQNITDSFTPPTDCYGDGYGTAFFCQTGITAGQSANYSFTWQPSEGQHDLAFVVGCGFDCVGDSQFISTNVIQASPTNGGIAERSGLTKTQKSVAKAVDPMCIALAGMEERSIEQNDMLATCQFLETDDLTIIAATLDLLAHEEVSAQGRVILETGKLQSTSIHRRLVALRGGARGINFSGLNIRIDGQTLPESIVIALFGGNVQGGSAGEEQGIASRWGSFVNATIIAGDKDKTSQETGFDFRSEGITAGADYRISNKLVVGGALGYTGKDSDFKGNAGNMDINNWHLTAYSSYYQSASFYLDGLIRLGKNNIDTRRRISLPGDPLQEGVGDTTGWEYAISLSGGYEYSRNALTFGPYGRLGYIQTSINSYTESASNPGGVGSGSVLTIDNQDVDSITAVLGSQVSYAISARDAVYLLQLNGEWEHEFRDNSRAISAQFAYDPTRTSFDIASDSPDRNYFNLGLGVTAVFANGRSGFFHYESRLGQDNIRQYWINGGIRIEL